MENSEVLAGKIREWMHISMRLSMHGLVRHSKELGLSVPQVTALIRIYRGGQCGVSEVAEHLGVTSAAASQMLDRLFKEGFVDRSEDPEDRRGKILTLTEAGERIVREGFDRRQGWLAELAATFDESESRIVAQALDLLVQRTHDLVPDCPNGGKTR
jgi:DNA-binding MarR family transcriptional regulator